MRDDFQWYFGTFHIAISKRDFSHEEQANIFREIEKQDEEAEKAKKLLKVKRTTLVTFADRFYED
ncbi:MAG: hypothetical protein VYE27_00955 [Pseudomonadota bacterium]|nr:hypothetical protein [Pseudomonadota bacterium]